MRPSKDAYFIAMARLVATRSTCARRTVGCVLVNARGHVLATGYNGVAAGLPHCNDPSGVHRCTGASAASGTNLDGCGAIHAEQNALLQCRDVFAIDTCYATTPPCVTCVKLLMNTSCRRIVFLGEYPHVAASAELFRSVDGTWVPFDSPGGFAGAAPPASEVADPGAEHRGRAPSDRPPA